MKVTALEGLNLYVPIDHMGKSIKKNPLQLNYTHGKNDCIVKKVSEF